MLIRTLLRSCSSSARVDSKNPRHANFDEQYAACSGMPMIPRAEPTLTMVPRSRGRIRDSAAMVPQTWPRNVTSTARWKSAGCTSQVGANTVVIASLTHTSIGPSSSSTRRAAASTWSNWLTSVGTTTVRPPGRPDLLGGGFQSRLAAGEQAHVEAVLCECTHRGPSHPCGRSRDHCYLAAWHIWSFLRKRGRASLAQLPTARPLPDGRPG